jgi:predicted alpha/beta-hydrolase family hydrolase
MLVLETPLGPARARLDLAARAPVAALILGHGAGGGIDSPDLVAVTEAALDLELAVARVEQPYRVAGRRSPAPAPQLDAAWVAVLAALRDPSSGASRREGGPLATLPLIVGGRSSGARVACRTAAAVGASAVLCLAFPLHPPGRAGDPSKSRLPELDGVEVPVLIVQGERDPFGIPPPRRRPARELAVVPGTHALRSKSAVAQAVRPWLLARCTSAAPEQ